MEPELAFPRTRCPPHLHPRPQVTADYSRPTSTQLAHPPTAGRGQARHLTTRAPSTQTRPRPQTPLYPHVSTKPTQEKPASVNPRTSFFTQTPAKPPFYPLFTLAAPSSPGNTTRLWSSWRFLNRSLRRAFTAAILSRRRPRSSSEYLFGTPRPSRPSVTAARFFPPKSSFVVITAILNQYTLIVKLSPPCPTSFHAARLDVARANPL